MKAKELMIGDWVNINGDRPMYSVVTSIGQDEVGVCNYIFDADVLLPIPLTPEILEKNGFISYPQDRIVIWRNDYLFDIECDLTTWEYYWANGDVRINYVHELQHALRLCRLRELADNFKV